MEEYVPIITLAVRGLDGPEAGIDFGKAVRAFVEERGFDEDTYFIEVRHGTYNPDAEGGGS